MLSSLLTQTRAPDEVLIFDDRSTDSSVQLIESFIKANCLDWELHINESNKGWRFNFYDAVQRASGDIIFFADQDDIWCENKIEVMSGIMERNGGIFCLCGGLHLIDAQNNAYTRKNSIKTCGDKYDYRVRRLSFYEDLQVFHWNSRLGCAMAIRRELSARLPKFERHKEFAHDMWAVNTAAVLGGCFAVNFPAVKYRIHDKNATAAYCTELRNANTAKTRYAFRERIRIKREALSHNLKYLTLLAESFSDNETGIDKRNYKKLMRVVRFYKKRISLLQNRRRFFAFFGTLRYLDYYVRYLGIRQLAADFVYAVRE
ncbi:MAG: glycosyltransferase [Firmicutes bacterium]|nr:glycosyltransferase [Bacillota bacterium]